MREPRPGGGPRAARDSVQGAAAPGRIAPAFAAHRIRTPQFSLRVRHAVREGPGRSARLPGSVAGGRRGTGPRRHERPEAKEPAIFVDTPPSPPTADAATPPAPAPARVVPRVLLAPRGLPPRRIDGAWWPRTYTLVAELPGLLAALPRDWGQIDRVTVSGRDWSALPGRMLVAGQVVRLGRTPDSPGPRASTVCLLAEGRGRWDLLVVPPHTPEAEALRRLRAGATDGG